MLALGKTSWFRNKKLMFTSFLLAELKIVLQHSNKANIKY